MGLLDKFTKKAAEDVFPYPKFEEWLNGVFEKSFPRDVIAVNFNIYEDADNYWSIEPVGTASFEEEDEDWACDEVTNFNTRSNPFTWQEKASWEDMLSKVKNMIIQYLDSGKHAGKLKTLDAVACGFVDGNLEILYKKR